VHVSVSVAGGGVLGWFGLVRLGSVWFGVCSVAATRPFALSVFVPTGRFFTLPGVDALLCTHVEVTV